MGAFVTWHLSSTPGLSTGGGGGGDDGDEGGEGVWLCNRERLQLDGGYIGQR